MCSGGSNRHNIPTAGRDPIAIDELGEEGAIDADGTTESGQRRSDKNAVINYYVIYHIIQLVIAAP